MEFFLILGVFFVVTWIIGQVLKAIVKAPSTIAYHVSGQAERDKNAVAEKQAKWAERIAEFEKEENERAKQQHEAFASEVKMLEASLQEKGITKQSLVVIRSGHSIRVDVARFDELQSYANYMRSSRRIGGLALGRPDDQLRPGHLSKLIRFTVSGPVVSVNVAKNEAFVRTDSVNFFDLPEHSIVKASPEFEMFYDEKVYKPLREKAQAEQAEQLKLDNAKSKLDSMFK